MKHWDLGLYWLARQPIPSLHIPGMTLWRTNKTWIDNLLRRSNPHQSRDWSSYHPDDTDRRVEIQDIHSGQVLECWAVTLLDPTKFEAWRPSDILIPEWNTGIIEFGGIEELAYWKYEGQELLRR